VIRATTGAEAGGMGTGAFRVMMRNVTQANTGLSAPGAGASEMLESATRAQLLALSDAANAAYRDSEGDRQTRIKQWLDLVDEMVRAKSDRSPEEQARLDAIAAKVPAQTSLLPEPTTQDQIRAETVKKGEKGKGAEADAGPLFNPDVGAQTDLVDMAKKPTSVDGVTPKDAASDALAKYSLAELEALRTEYSKNYDRSLLPAGVVPMDLTNEIATRRVNGETTADDAAVENWWVRELTPAGRGVAVQDAGLKSRVSKVAWQHLSAEEKAALGRAYKKQAAPEPKDDIDAAIDAGLDAQFAEKPAPEPKVSGRTTTFDDDGTYRIQKGETRVHQIWKGTGADATLVGSENSLEKARATLAKIKADDARPASSPLEAFKRLPRAEKIAVGRELFPHQNLKTGPDVERELERRLKSDTFMHVRSGQATGSAGGTPKSAEDSIAEVNARFDKELTEAMAKVKAATPGEKSAAAAKSAVKNTAKGLDAAVTALVTLFDPKGKVGSGPVFDEETYARAKPHFQEAIGHFIEAGADIATAARELIRHLAEKGGMSRDGIEAIRPYIRRFIGDYRDGKLESPTEAADAGSLQTDPVPAGDQAGPEADAVLGDGDRQPLGTGVAGSGPAAGGSGRVPGGAKGSRGAGARGSERAGEQPSGPTRDSGTVRTEPQSPDSDFVVDADEIGKGGLGKKYRDNVAAIRLLKSLEAEGRTATAEERKQLSKYVGWGAMKGPFDPANKAWAKQHAEIKELLTDAEFKAARRSTLNAHYTSPAAIQAMNAALKRLGYTGGRMLEPSVGVGNFFGLMPADVRHASQLHGVELDSLTSRMVAALYPRAKIAKATGFQDFAIPNGYFDLVQGNPPFGNESVSDMDRSPYSGFSIHNYFLAKGIDKLRPGGLMQVIVSHNFLDAQDNRARKWIADRADLISAVRLPNTAFEENAGTVVVTDILTFQRRPEGAEAKHLVPKWIDVVDQQNTNPKTGETVTHKVSPIFVEKPDLVLGKPTAGGMMNRPNEYTVEATGDLKKQLEDWTQTLPEGIYHPIRREAAADVEMAVPDGIKIGSFFVSKNGEILQRGEDELGTKTTRAWVVPNSRAAERMKGMIDLRDALRTQMRLERSDAPTAEIEDNRRLLNTLYDAFLKKHGHLNSQTNRRLFMDDTEAQLVQALEFDFDKGVSKATAEKEGIDARDPSATKADIFKRRVAFPPQDFLTVTTAKDALLASLNYRGKIDPAYLTEVYDKPLDKIVEELGDVVYQDPEAGLVTADEYLSGDVKTKLDEAKAAAERDAKYQKNVDALEKVIPADKKPSEISASIGASFIPADIYQEFVTHISGATATANYVRATGQWILNYGGREDTSLTTGKYGTPKLSSLQLFQLSMLGKGAVVRETTRHADGSSTTVVLQKETEQAREKQNAIKAEWQAWLWRDPARAERVAAIYNEKMNRLVDRKFDGSHLSFPGMNPAITLLEHQKNGVWRGLQSYQVLYDHVVGAGKTFEMATLAMEMRRLGIARKPLFVVPNHLTMQWRSEFTRLYPGSNILAATPEDFSRDNRERLFSKIVTGDWDAVVIGHSSLKKIGLPEATERAVLQEQVDEISAAIEEMKRERGDRNIIKDMEKIKTNLESKMTEKLAAIGTRSRVVSFDELGVDAVFVDEMHEFKNLMYTSTMDRSPGMGNPKGSAKAFDLFVKVRWLFDTFGAKTPFISATGTPVSNSLVEMFNMQRYMQYPTLKAEGLNVFDAWAKQFGNVENVYEVAPSGSGYRQSTRFAKFTNLPALMGLYNTFADTVTLDDLKAQEEAQGKAFPVPKLVGGRPQIVVAQRSPTVASFMGVPRAMTMEDGSVEFTIDLNKPIEIHQDEKTGKWSARVGDWPIGSAFETREDAHLKLVEDAVSPVVDVDPNSILGRFARLKELTKATKGKVNALSLTGEANKAGLDYRLIDPSAPDFPGSKINMAVDNMVKIYRQWRADKGAQLVFCDLSIPLSARASYTSKARRLYVVNDAGALEMKRGTMHTMEGRESLPYFIVTRGEKDLRRFDVYDAASGVRMIQDARAKNDAIDQANALIADPAKRQAWIDKRETAGDITQEMIDEYNNEHDVETEGIESFTREDIAGVSGASAFSVYDDIKAKLVKKGIPEREIAFIHDFSTPTAKDKLFKAVNSGEVRFLLGSTPKMGAGTNVQKRLVGLHHIDAPWRPSDLEQREGRIIRRGNDLYARDPENFEIFIGRYATEQTYDTRRWQLLEHKARGIEQLRNYDGTINEIDDIEGEAANAADMKAAASGDPMILEETRLRNEVRRLEQLQVAHADDVMSMNYKAKSAENYATKYGPERLAGWQTLAETVKANPAQKDGWAPPTIDGTVVEDKEAAEEKLADVVDAVRTEKRDFTKVTYRGLTFSFDRKGGSLYAYDPSGDRLAYWLSDQAFSASGFIQRMRNYVDRIPSQIDSVKAEMKRMAEEAVRLREQAKVPFGMTELLEKTREEHKTVHRTLMAKGPAVPEAQKAAVAAAIEEQKKRLEKLGFGKALREFYRQVRSVGEAPAKPRQSRMNYIKAQVMLKRPVDLRMDAERTFRAMAGEASILPKSIPEIVVTHMEPIKGTSRYTVYGETREGEKFSYEDEGKNLHRTQGMYSVFNGQAGIALLPLDLTGDLVQGIRAVRAHESVHALRSNGFLPGSGRDRTSVWGRLVGHADRLGVLHMSRAQLYERMGDPRALVAPKDVSTYEVYAEIYGTRPYARELMDQEAVAHMVEVYKLGGWKEQEIAPVKDLLEAMMSGETGRQDRGDILALDMIRSVQDTEVGQDMRREFDALGFYSGALEAAKALKQGKGTPEQMLAQLKKAGVKDGELEATGLQAFLTDPGKKSVTQTEIVRHLRQNRVKVSENLYEASKDTYNAVAQRMYGDPYDYLADHQQEAVRAQVGSQATRWSGYSLDGSNPTYRETVIHLTPEGSALANEPIEELDRLARDHFDRPFNQLSLRERQELDEVYYGRKGDYVSGHFAEHNIVGHMMASMVTTHDGNPTYLLDQIQSDWGQAIRDRGANTPEARAERVAKLEEMKAELEAIAIPAWMHADGGVEHKHRDKVLAPFGKKSIFRPFAKVLPPRLFNALAVAVSRGNGNYIRGLLSITDARRDDIATADEAREIRKFVNRTPALNAILETFKAAAKSVERKRLLKAEIQQLELDIKHSPPGHPLVNTTDQWVNTTLRRAIRQAVEADAEYIAIPSGDTVLSYNPGNAEGMRGFYGAHVARDEKEVEQALAARAAAEADLNRADRTDWARNTDLYDARDRAISRLDNAIGRLAELERMAAATTVGIVPKNLRNLLSKIDKTIQPKIVQTVETPSKSAAGKGFTLFPITEKVRQAVLKDGLPLFSALPRMTPPPIPGTLTPAATAKKAEMERALEVVARMTGGQADVRFPARISLDGIRQQDIDAARAMGIEPVAQGVYRAPIGDGRALIELAYAVPGADVATTAGHEAYHHVERFLASDAEMRLLRAPSEMARATQLAAAELGQPAEFVAKMPDYEIRAIAFQRYRRMREEGAPVGTLHMGVRRIWDRMIQLLRNIQNALKGLGFDSMESIFERARTGELASRAPEPAPSDGTPDLLASVASRAIAADTESRLDRIRIQLQDKVLPLRRAEEGIARRTGTDIMAHMSAYIRESLFHGRAGERQNDITAKFWEPLVEILRDARISDTQFDDYLYARHAEERNAAIAEGYEPSHDFHRATKPGGEDIVGGSGMSKKEADAILAKAAADPQAAAYLKAAALIDTMIDETLELQRDAGLITKDQFNENKRGNRWHHYVPLRGTEMEDGTTPGRGRGYDTRGQEWKSALGRKSKADSPLSYAFQQARMAIVRAEKNRVDQTLLNLVEGNADPELWRVYKGERKRRRNPDTGLVETYWAPPFNPQKDNIFGVKVGGKQRYIEIRNPTLARALRTQDAGVWGTSVGQAFYKLARLYAGLVTSYNPEFVVSNFFRDLEAALINVGDLKNLPAGTRMKIAKEALAMKSIRGVFQAVHAKDFQQKLDAAKKKIGGSGVALYTNLEKEFGYAGWYEEYRLAGGKISFMDMFNVEDIKANIAKEINAGNTWRALKRVAKLVDNANTAVENSARLSLYITLRKNGFGLDQAASAARELTVNFNRKGEMGPGINALYLFFNASIQGTTRMVQAMARSKTVQVAVASIFATGFLLDVLNRLMAGDDDDGENAYDKIKPWIKEKNLIVMLPGRKDYVMIPLSYGYNVPYLAGQGIASVIHGKTKPMDALSHTFGAALESFSPFGAAGSFNQMVAPTLLDPIVQANENKKWFGGPIQPKKYDEKKPDSENFFSTAPHWAVDLARALNWAGGGNQAKASPYLGGALDISPNTIAHYVEFMGGGVSRFVLNSWNTGARGVGGQDWLPEQTPFVRRLYGGRGSLESRRFDFYEKFNEVDKVHYEIQQHQRNKRFDEANAVRQEHVPEVQVYGQFASTSKRLSAFRKQRDSLNLNRELASEDRQKRIDELTRQENDLILQALAAYQRAKKSKPSE
jgi:N12 class adenine-specific DNA methylase/adenine-specific DNA methylase